MRISNLLFLLLTALSGLAQDENAAESDDGLLGKFVIVAVLGFLVFFGVFVFGMYKLIRYVIKNSVQNRSEEKKKGYEQSVDEKGQKSPVQKASLVDAIKELDPLRVSYESEKKEGILHAEANYEHWKEYVERFRIEIIPRILASRKVQLQFDPNGFGQEFFDGNPLYAAKTFHNLSSTDHHYSTVFKIFSREVLLSAFEGSGWMAIISLSKPFEGEFFASQKKTLLGKGGSVRTIKHERIKTPVVAELKAGYQIFSEDSSVLDRIDLAKFEKMINYFESKYHKTFRGLYVKDDQLIVNLPSAIELFHPGGFYKDVLVQALSDKLHDDLTFIEQLIDEVKLFKEVVR